MRVAACQRTLQCCPQARVGGAIDQHQALAAELDAARHVAALRQLLEFGDERPHCRRNLYGGSGLRSHGLLQLGAQRRACSQRRLQFRLTLDLDPLSRQHSQHLAQRRWRSLRRTQLRQELFGRQAQPLGCSQLFGAQHLLGKGTGDANLATAAQQGTVDGDELCGIRIARVPLQRQGQLFFGRIAQ